MSMKIEKCKLEYLGWSVEALIFLPSPAIQQSESIALISHGYTSHKTSILNWPIRLAEEGVPCILFDQPGHYLGSFNEVADFEEYKESAHELFLVAKSELEKHIGGANAYQRTILCGHSLSGLLSLKALELAEFSFSNTIAVPIGLGMAPQDKLHLFDTPLFKSTLLIREQFVSPALGYKAVFQWIKEEKEALELENKEIYLLCGEDDNVVGADGAERLQQMLQAQGNKVILEKPKRMPHHQPELAAPHLKKFLKDHCLI